MRILKDDTMAMIIDYQAKLIPSISGFEELIKNSRMLLKGLNILGVPLVMTEQYPRGLGPTVPEITEVSGGCVVFEKLSFSCCDDPAVMKLIDNLGRKNIVLCGIEAHVCLLQTAVDLRAAGYNVIVVADCIGSRRELDKEYAVIRAASEGIVITTWESLIFELTRTAGADPFKKISDLIKSSLDKK